MDSFSDGYVCRFRILRQKYGISLEELNRYTGIGYRYLNGIELRKICCTDQSYKKIAIAFERILCDRLHQTTEQFIDFESQKDNLLDPVKERSVEYAE